MKIYKNIIIILILSLSVKSFSQDFTVGVNYGFGMANFKKQSDASKTQLYSFQKLGLSFEFSPYFSKFFVVSGINYETNSLGNMLTVPFGFKICVGESFRPYVKLGGYYSHVLRSKQEDYILNEDLGIEFGFGVLYSLNKRIRIEFGYSQRFGFKGAVEEEIMLPLNQISYEKYDLRAGNLELGLKYRF
jgi:hypothetical protein